MKNSESNHALKSSEDSWMAHSLIIRGAAKEFALEGLLGGGLLLLPPSHSRLLGSFLFSPSGRRLLLKALLFACLDFVTCYFES